MAARRSSAPSTAAHFGLLCLAAFGTVGLLAQEDKDCLKPIHKAAANGDARRVQALLLRDKYLADAEDSCESKVRPLLLAANSGSYGAVAALLDAGATADVAHAGNGVTPLHAAAAAGHEPIVRMLLDANAKCDRAEERNWTALSFAAQQGHADVVHRLIKTGANLGWLSGAGLSPWALASDAGRTEIADVLVAAGAPAAEEATLWLTGQLPMKALRKAGVVDADSIATRLFGAYRFDRVAPGMSPEQLAIYRAFASAKDGQLPGQGEDGAIETTPDAVGGGPMPTYIKAATAGGGGGGGSGGGSGDDDGDDDDDDSAPAAPAAAHYLAFDPNPGEQMWSLTYVEGPPPGSVEGDAASRGIATRVLRGKAPLSAPSNPLDAVHVPLWEIAVAVAPDASMGRKAGVEWIPASRLRLTRGTEGQRLWREQQAWEAQGTEYRRAAKWQYHRSQHEQQGKDEL